LYAQVYLLVITALALGFVFGLIFGLSDVEDQTQSMIQLRHALSKELNICYPIGAVLGGLAAAANEHLRSQAPNNERRGPNGQGEYRPIDSVDLEDANEQL
jgi:Flp pilus assembly protein protease CpaA